MGHALALTLIRHGLTIYNEEKRYIGVTDLPLSDRGRADILAMTNGKTSKREQLIITSNLRRCIETTELLYPEQSYTSLATLREIDFGEWEGKTYDQLKRNSCYRNWLNDPACVTPPKGESLKHFQQRTELAMQQVISLAEEKEATHATVITHGGVIRQWLTSFAPEKRAFFEWQVPIGCAYALVGKREDVRRGLRFTSLLEEPITGKTTG